MLISSKLALPHQRWRRRQAQRRFFDDPTRKRWRRIWSSTAGPGAQSPPGAAPPRASAAPPRVDYRKFSSI